MRQALRKLVLLTPTAHQALLRDPRHPFEQLVHPLDKQNVSPTEQLDPEKGAAVTQQLRLVRKGGDSIWIETRSTPVLQISGKYQWLGQGSLLSVTSVATLIGMGSSCGWPCTDTAAHSGAFLRGRRETPSAEARTSLPAVSHGRLRSRGVA